MRLQQNCLACNKELKGRVDKKFCDPFCKSAYHYKKAQDEAPKFFNKVENQLKLNRRILKNFNKAGKATVRAEVLLEKGFNPKFFTHYWKNTKGDVYFFVYEYGFLRKTEGTVKKFILVQWQSYMEEK